MNTVIKLYVQFLPIQMLLDSKSKCLIDANDNNSSVLSHTSLWNHHIEAYSAVYHSGHIPFSSSVYLDCTGIRHCIVHSFHLFLSWMWPKWNHWYDSASTDVCI